MRAVMLINGGFVTGDEKPKSSKPAIQCVEGPAAHYAGSHAQRRQAH